MYTFFGKEPAVIVGLLQAVLTALVVFVPDGLSNEQVGLIVAVLNAAGAAFIAWRTRHTTLAVVIGAFNALFALLAGFGLELTQEQTGGILMVVTAILALINRQLTSPVDAVPGDATVEPVPAG